MRISEVKNLVEASLLEDHVDIGLDIVPSHLSPIVFPELLVFNGQGSMFLTKVSSSAISHEYIETLIIKLKG